MGIALDKLKACRSIDAAAGDARRQYITDVPGQQAVYTEKLRQANAYIAARASVGAGADVPVYILRESQARSVDPLTLAQEIVQAAAVYDEDKGPAIEAARLAGKDAVMSASASGDVEAARLAAIAALLAI